MTSDQHDHSHCLSMFQKLSEYIDNELDEMTCRAIERHVEECVPCKICLETLKRTVNLCKKVDSKPVPESVSLKLKELIQSMSDGRSSVQK
ncbi:MAG: anti-sigma factor [Desulfobacterales bacterium]|jgi:RNA polymerase sigma-70 factor (ECF subfamily)